MAIQPGFCQQTDITSLATAVALAAAEAKVDTAILDIADVQTEANKIDLAAASGLGGVADSLSYSIGEVDRHLHNTERWLGKLAVQTATDWADDTLAPFRAISGADAWGTDGGDAALVLGTDDTPDAPNMVYFDLHRIFIVASSSGTPWKLRLIWGTGTMGDAIAAGQYSSFLGALNALGANTFEGPSDVLMRRRVCGADQVWLQAWNATNNATIDFLVGFHEYEG